MLSSSDRMVFGSLFAFIELPERIPAVLLNIFSKNRIGGGSEKYCVVEYPLGYTSVFPEFPGKIPAITL